MHSKGKLTWNSPIGCWVSFELSLVFIKDWRAVDCHTKYQCSYRSLIFMNDRRTQLYHKHSLSKSHQGPIDNKIEPKKRHFLVHFYALSLGVVFLSYNTWEHRPHHLEGHEDLCQKIVSFLGFYFVWGHLGLWKDVQCHPRTELVYLKQPIAHLQVCSIRYGQACFCIRTS